MESNSGNKDEVKKDEGAETALTCINTTGLTLSLIVDFLKENGYTVKPDGEVVNFKYEGDWYYVLFNELKDNEFTTTGKYYHSFENNPNINFELAYQAAVTTSQRVKFVKAYCDDLYVHLRIEQAYESISQFARFFRRSVAVLQLADNVFCEEYSQLSAGSISVIEKYSAEKAIQQNKVVS